MLVFVATAAFYATLFGLGIKFIPRQLTFTVGNTIRAGKRSAATGLAIGQQVVSVTLYTAITSLLLVVCSGISLILAVWSGSEFLFWFVFTVSIIPMVIVGLAMYAVANSVSGIGEALTSVGEWAAKNKFCLITIIPALLGLIAWAAGFGVKKMGAASNALFQMLGLASVSCYGLAAIVLMAKLFGFPERVANFQFLALSVALGVFAAMSHLLGLSTFHIFTWKRLSSFVMVTFLVAIAQIILPQTINPVVKIAKNGYDHLTHGMGWAVASSTAGNDLSFRRVIQSGGTQSFTQTPSGGFKATGGLVPYGRHCLLDQNPQEVTYNGIKLFKGYCPAVMDPATALDAPNHPNDWVWLPLQQTEVAADPLAVNKP